MTSVCEQPFEPFVPEGVRAWTVRRCAGMLMGDLIINESHVRRFPGGELPPGVYESVAYPCSLHLVRAMAENVPENLSEPKDPFPTTPAIHAEACRFHLGRDTRHCDGVREYFPVVHCHVAIEGGDAFWKQLAFARSFFGPPFAGWGDLDTLWEAGTLYHLTAYETPWLHETIAHSDRLVCGQPL